MTTGRSQITQVFTAEDATSAANSIELDCQRFGDESGAIQLEFNQDPGAGATGSLLMQGRLAPTADWVTIQALTIVSFQSANSQLFTDIPMMPQMRVRIDSPGTITGGTTLTAWVME